MQLNRKRMLEARDFIEALEHVPDTGHLTRQTRLDGVQSACLIGELNHAHRVPEDQDSEILYHEFFNYFLDSEQKLSYGEVTEDQETQNLFDTLVGKTWRLNDEVGISYNNPVFNPNHEAKLLINYKQVMLAHWDALISRFTERETDAV